jgi:hypothetical protein
MKLLLFLVVMVVGVVLIGVDAATQPAREETTPIYSPQPPASTEAARP